DGIRDRNVTGVQTCALPIFPTCISIDHVAAHYSPMHDDILRFRHGNVVKLDLGAQLDGWIADTAVTVEVGTRNWTELIRASELRSEERRVGEERGSAAGWGA